MRADERETRVRADMRDRYVRVFQGETDMGGSLRERQMCEGLLGGYEGLLRGYEGLLRGYEGLLRGYKGLLRGLRVSHI